MEMRYPGGMKVIEYRKAKLEKFAPYLLKDGLVTKLTTYKDLDCKIFADVSVFSLYQSKKKKNSHFVTFLGTKASTIKEWFKHRSDHLDERELHTDSNVTTEHFRPGRSDALKCNLTHTFLI